MEPIHAFAGALARVIINPLIILIFGAGMVWFVYGLTRYLYMLNVKGEQDEEGKKHMFWGMVGMFIMVAAFALIKIIGGAVGATLPAGY